MLKNVTFITLFMFAGLLCAADKLQDTSKLDDLDALLEGIDKGSNVSSAAPVEPAVPAAVSEATPEAVPAPAPAPAVAPEPAVVATPAPEPQPVVASVPTPAPAVVVEPAPVTKAAPEPKKVETTDESMYHYAYIPDDSLDDNGPTQDKFSKAGHPGLFFVSFIGQGVFYKDYNKGVPGFEVESGFQLRLFKYLSLVGALNSAYRRGFVTGDKFYSFGALGQIRVRTLSWLYPFFEGGIECIKIARLGWQPPAQVLGGGLMIRMGSADRKAEYNLYKLVGVTRTMLILSFDHVKTSHNFDVVPSAYLFKGGLSFEF